MEGNDVSSIVLKEILPTFKENYLAKCDMGIQITTDFLDRLGMTEAEFLIEMAVHFYDIGKMSMGQARGFAKLDVISFQKEMQKRNVCIKYDIEDLEEDLKTIENLESSNS